MKQIEINGKKWEVFDAVYDEVALLERIKEAAEEVATTDHQDYANNDIGQYGLGVADGHKCAANMVKDALKAHSTGQK